MNIKVRDGVEKDYPAIFSMIKSLAKFEKASEKVINSVEQMIEDKDLFFTLVAEKEDGEIVGFALFYFAYYTWVGKSLYLDDLYVKEKYRGRGTGTKLLNEVIGFARGNNCKRIRWQVLNWNTPAVELYKKLGVNLDKEWINCDYE